MPPKRGARKALPASRVKEREAPQSVEEPEVVVEITDMDDFNEAIKILIHGPSGHGKTVLAGGAPNATFITTEKGVIAAKRAGSKARVMRTPSWPHVVAAKARADREFGPDDWVILDSLTKMQVLMIRWILESIHEQNSARDLDIPAIQDHQKWQNYFKRFFDQLIDAPYNVIFITTEMYREDKDGDTIVLPAITGKDYEICNYIRAQTDVNLYYGITDKTADGTPVRRALAQPVPPFVACKDRYNALGRYQDVPDDDFTAMREFIEMIEDSAA